MTGGEVRIGPGGIVDLDAMMAVMDDSFDPGFGEAWTAPQCAGLLPMAGVWLTLAWRDREIVGFALARLVLREAELLLLAVKRDAQCNGAGRMLLTDFVTAARSHGAERLHLEVRDGNSAVSLYAAAGFAQVGRRRGYYTGSDGQIYDALTLAKSASA